MTTATAPPYVLGSVQMTEAAATMLFVAKLEEKTNRGFSTPLADHIENKALEFVGEATRRPLTELIDENGSNHEWRAVEIVAEIKLQEWLGDV